MVAHMAAWPAWDAVTHSCMPIHTGHTHTHTHTLVHGHTHAHTPVQSVQDRNLEALFVLVTKLDLLLVCFIHFRGQHNLTISPLKLTIDFCDM